MGIIAICTPTVRLITSNPADLNSQESFNSCVNTRAAYVPLSMVQNFGLRWGAKYHVQAMSYLLG